MNNPDNIIYNYLGRSQHIAPEDELWVICGDYSDGEGVLAFCYNEEDAAYGASIFSNSPRFNGIHYHKFIKEIGS